MFLAPCALIDGGNWVGQGSPKEGECVCVGDACPQLSSGVIDPCTVEAGKKEKKNPLADKLARTDTPTD